MMKTFSIGGIHPSDSKISKDCKIEVLPVPSKVFISVAQHLGAPATPVVKAGDTVKVGQVIAEPAGFISAYVHSSVSGTVKSVGPRKDLAGNNMTHIEIEVEGDEWAEGDAEDLPFDDDSFDTVVSTFAMCGFPDYDKALSEIVRVVRPNGRILLADHVPSTNPVLHLLQKGLEAVTSRANGEYWTRRPLPRLERMGVRIVDAGRLHFGIIEHLHARKQ